MGSNNVREERDHRRPREQLNEGHLLFYMDVVDPNLGPVKIYTCPKMKLAYILRYDRAEEDTRIYNTMKKLEVD